MTTADLQKKVAEILGVSVSEKELAFEIFISKICDVLTDEVTLKVQRVGFFQLKKGFTRATAESLLFIPLSEELYRDSKNLFLTIPIPAHLNSDEEIDSDVFSIGVGKPILPLSENETQNTETSYAILRKSIEERVVEILSEADQLPNFNIWEDYYKSVRYVEHDEEKDKLNELTADLDFKEEFMAEDLAKNLLELSSELDVQETEEKNDESHEVSLYDLLGDYQADNPAVEQRLIGDYDIGKDNSQGEDEELEQSLLNVIENTEDSSDEPEVNIVQDEEERVEKEFEEIDETKVEEEKSDSQKTGHGFDEVESIVSDLLKNYEDQEDIVKKEVSPEEESAFEELVDKDPVVNEEEKKETEQTITNAEEIENIIGDLSKSFDDDFTEDEEVNADHVEENTEIEDGLLEIEVPTQTKEVLFEIKRESMLEEVDLEAAKENDDVEPVYYLGLKNKEGEPVEWDWGDELKEEFGVEFLKEEQEKLEIEESKKEQDEEPDTLEQIFRRAKPKITKHEDEFDNHVKDENEYSEPHQVLEFSGQPPRYQFVEDNPTPKTNIGSTNYTALTETMEENMKGNDKGFSFGKIFLIIFSSFVVVATLIIYFLMSNKDSDQVITSQRTGGENYSLEQDTAKNPIDTSQIIADDFNDFPRVAVLPAKGTQTGNTTVQQNVPSLQISSSATDNKKSSSDNDLYKKLETDTRVGKTIYFDGKSYNYQASSWRNKAKAEQEVKRLRGLGLDAFLTEAFLPEKGGTWYRVRIGNYKTREEAEQNSIKNNF